MEDDHTQREVAFIKKTWEVFTKKKGESTKVSVVNMFHNCLPPPKSALEDLAIKGLLFNQNSLFIDNIYMPNTLSVSAF